MKTKENIHGLPPDIGTLMNRLILLEELYREAAAKFDDGILKEQFSRLAREKEIFLHDFTNLMNFTVGEYKDKFKERIRTEKEPVRIEFEEVLLNKEEDEILQHCAGLERNLADHYDMLLRLIDGDEFARMVVKMQAKETKRSIVELDALGK
jgi:hypothetical protein